MVQLSCMYLSMEELGLDRVDHFLNLVETETHQHNIQCQVIPLDILVNTDQMDIPMDILAFTILDKTQTNLDQLDIPLVDTLKL